MIATALTIVVDELNAYINEIDPPVGTRSDEVELGNIAMLENGGTNSTDLNNKVLLSLVNIEEEKRLKNTRNYKKIENDTEYSNPPISLNLYLLLSANFEQYNKALKRLSQVIEFFQGKYVFSLSNSPSETLSTNPEASEIRLILDIHTLNFEQINDLWGSLGGKQVPFVMYRARMVKVERDAILSTAPLIEEVEERETIN